MDREGPDVAFPVACAVPALPSVGCRVRLVQDVCAAADGLVVMGVRVGDSHVSPAVADMASVQDLGLILLGHGHPAVRSDLGYIVAEPGNFKPEDVAKLCHRLSHIEVGQAGTDHVLLTWP